METKFINFPVCDFAKQETYYRFEKAIRDLEGRISKGIDFGLFINGKWIKTNKFIESRNPSKHSQVIGKINKAGNSEVEAAIYHAKNSKDKWRIISGRERASYLFNVANQMKENVYDLSTLICFESGKNLSESYADVGEAIDFLNFYGSRMIELDSKSETQATLGEDNFTTYFPKGVVGVISPWNFPLAILTGMTSAALVTGNTVIIKPSSDTPLIAGMLVEMFNNTNLPSGVLNFIPGSGKDIGEKLINSKDVDMIAFTGSRDIGVNINNQLAQKHQSHERIKTSILELGGKNGIIVDKTADFDITIPDILYSAFGYQGQKCSACSRLIIHESVYDLFIDRLISSAKSLKVGDAKISGTDIGPIINRNALNTIVDYIHRGISDGGKFLLEGSISTRDGFYISPTIMEVNSDNIIAKEEIFGPVLAVMKVDDFDLAMRLLNKTNYALTAGLYSRTLKNIEQFLLNAEAGNRYVNRGITGAVVERQPFGGFKMSGAGSKAGGINYLHEFMYDVTNSINTVTSGHIPQIEEVAKGLSNRL